METLNYPKILKGLKNNNLRPIQIKMFEEFLEKQDFESANKILLFELQWIVDRCIVNVSYEEFQKLLSTNTAENYYENGRLKERCTMIEGKQEGHFEEFYDNGYIKNCGTIRNNKLHGMHISYYESGVMSSISSYTDGILTNIVSFDEGV